MSRVGLGRHGQLEDSAGDPLDGLVNLFDVGIVLAVGFLIAGLAIGAKAATSTRATTQRTITTPASKATATGRGQPVGQVYRLPDGTLVLKSSAP